MVILHLGLTPWSKSSNFSRTTFAEGIGPVVFGAGSCQSPSIESVLESSGLHVKT